MTKNIHSITIEETSGPGGEGIYTNWCDLTSKKSWAFEKGNTGMAREIIEQIGRCLGVEAHVKENPNSVPMAHSGENH